VAEEVRSTGIQLLGCEATGGHIPSVQYIKNGFQPIIL